MEETETESGGFYTPRGLIKAVVELVLAGHHHSFSSDPTWAPSIGYTSISDLDFVLTRADQAAVYIARDLIRSRLDVAAYGMRTATTTEERRQAAREFLSALGDLLACLIGFVVRLLLRLLSGLLGRATVIDVSVWPPIPLERTPEITPRGPNVCLPYEHQPGRGT
ncbi:hypothetical protein OIE62_15935 [Streptomyces scopuliridis]|uniref:Uncharacterized protein n=1 Tax=Streptomyces scopuliridis TaxID=452529 RepID=A0ACD4ZN78_9ACTN|nr:hypothetical protein [Streptomyces scopuliridis]WSB99932.1 hypothetical protein OG835_25020 [Streptomyces scopuliridis]WSC06369.1 hypothetical protein OIE62_15935 [Streptomyces scopuliridis]